MYIDSLVWVMIRDNQMYLGGINSFCCILMMVVGLAVYQQSQDKQIRPNVKIQQMIQLLKQV